MMSTAIQRRRFGFTLIEMLLVVAIIVFLIGMLLPSLNRARSQSRTLVCTSNQAALSSATLAYSASNRGKLFPYDNADGLKHETFWMTLIDLYIGESDQLRMCPETVMDATLQTSPQGGGWGTVRAAWGNPAGLGGFLGKNYGSYGWNAWMHSNTTDYIRTGNIAAGSLYWKNLKLCRTPKTTPFFSDMHWVDTWFQNKSGGAVSNPPANLFAENSGAGRVCIDRHNRGVVHGYVDGSAGWTSLEGLWQLTWNSQSTPMNPPWAIPAQ